MAGLRFLKEMQAWLTKKSVWSSAKNMGEFLQIFEAFLTQSAEEAVYEKPTREDDDDIEDIEYDEEQPGKRFDKESDAFITGM